MRPAEALTRIQEALEWAADVLKPFESGSARARLKDDDELVTAADHAVNKVLHSILRRKGEGWLSKESADDGSRLNNDRVWIVDPIGGTREFIAGVPEYCVSIAFVQQGVAVAGGIMNPATHETFLGAAGAGVTYMGEDVPVAAAASLAGATVLASRREVMRGEWEAFRNSGFAIRPLGSVAYKLARVAAGLADATWTLTPKHEWDVAAGVALMEASGGFVGTLDFRRPMFNRADTLLPGLAASRRNLEGEIVKLLRPRIAPNIATPASVASPGARAFEDTVRTVIQECLAVGRRSRQD
ncbi:MAG TPA: 3'(2'),5'-bisphosphate nucleotidase CysQ [Terriglobia bacterium]|nr:3'(2'),5'-bisphosphate nucleotidase CysQ [Terriglobia bacterium]